MDFFKKQYTAYKRVPLALNTHIDWEWSIEKTFQANDNQK